MCRPTYFDVEYSINPWMNPNKPISRELAMAQWQVLVDLVVSLGHRVDVIEPLPGLPDMVFAANGAAVVAHRALVARFRYPQRAKEASAYLEWFRAGGYAEVRQAEHTSEGQGDFLLVGDRVLAGHGFRTVRAAHIEAAQLLGLPVVGLTLIDPHFYHLDTALAVLDKAEIMYYPRAFSPASLAVLRKLYPDAILAGDADAAVLGLNAVSDGRHVIMPEAAIRLITELRKRGYEPIGVDLSELLKAGGGIKCCMLELTRGVHDNRFSP